jgi:hypothetical protein
MIIIGVDYHPSFQQIAFLMEDTTVREKQNDSIGTCSRGMRVRVGVEATGSSRRFEPCWPNLISSCGSEIQQRSRPARQEAEDR